MTNRYKILKYMKKRGFITKSIAGGYNWSFGMGDHIMKLRKRHVIETIMKINPKTKSTYAEYRYIGKRK